ncbi:Sec7-domain-containing protein [Armillaria solidipes]|uniref:Sec7-domain-containing protein n=1 Tax=Armillaria solidipes TaxID=1076256 RepID=A0A2H3C8J8_9AGAR|nr:Sec7-domain-containing protein [Armillaria solidipes]
MAHPQPSTTRRTVSQKHVLYSEILSVTSVMRKNSRWASATHFMNTRDSALGSNLGLRISTAPHHDKHYGSGSREIDLMVGFQELKRALRDVEDVTSVPLPTILGPFFAIIRSPLSTGPITSAALSSLHKFFTCGLISSQSVSLDAALVELSSTVSHCKFEPSDSSGDEVVLLKIMSVIQDCLCGHGTVLGDVEVCEMLETVLTTCCQMRLSETLRRSAETTMHALVRTVFSRLHCLDAASEEEKLRGNDEETQDGEIKMSVSTEQVPEQPLPEELPTSVPEELNPPPSPAPSGPRPQYGLPSILELLRVLVHVLDPNDQQHTDSTRLIVLGILNAALEEVGPRITDFPSLEALILDPGCKFLFQLARSENSSVLHSSLRTISTMFDTMRQHLKLQQELFLAFTIDRLAPTLSKAKTQQAISKKGVYAGSPRPGTPGTPSLGPADDELQLEKQASTPPRLLVPPARGETRDLSLEILSQISRHASFMVDLYTNYDCDINCENLMERLTDFLTKSVYPAYYSGGLDVQQRNAQFLCLDLLLAFVNDMAGRANGASTPWPSEFPSPESLLQKKSQKKLILAGASRFNAKPKAGIAFLEENGLIYADLSPEVSKAQSLARFLKSCTRLDKRLLGDYISKPDNIEVLKAFIGLFDFKNKPMADAMRELLETFRLPGEAQQINRITETFASIYFASEPAEIRSEDAVYVLAYSIIMLNTDLHNPQVRKRMSFEEYQKNLRGVNDKGDFPAEYLQNIYDSIRKREIVMPEEHTGQLGFEYAWKELLTRSRQAGDFMICNTPHFDIDIFKSVWKPVISAIAYAFISFDDDYIIQRSVAGFRQCATLAGHFRLPDVFDFVVVSLSQATSLLSDSVPVQVPNYPVVDVEGQSVTVSNLSISFGTNFKGQLAAVVLFNIVNGNGNALREGWTQIFEMFQNLFLHSLLPTRMLQMEDFLGGVSMIPLRGSQPQRQSSRSDGGLLSALSSYLMTPYAASSEALPEATDADVENTLCTIDCITSCRLDELYSQIMQLDLQALVAAVRALEALAHDRTVAKLKQGSDDGNLPPQDNDTYSLPYDPASIFLLETMVSIACQTPQHIEDLWPIVFEHLSNLLSSSEQYSVLLIERAVVGLLRLCLILAQIQSLRDQIYVSFDLLSGLTPAIANSVAEQVISGVILIVQKHRDVISSQTEWNLVFALVRSTISHPEAARLSFELVTSLVADGPQQFITVDNFSGLITLLDEFASIAGTSVQSQQHGRRREPATSASSPAVERGKKAIELLVNLKKWLSTLDTSSLSRDKAWHQLWLPLLTSLSRQSSSASREVRHIAMSQLQRVLLGSHVMFDEASNVQTEEIFNRVVFPLLDDLLKPQIFLRDPRAMPETRLRASALLCKTFMHFEVRESQAQSDIRVLWIQILDLLDRLMNIDKKDQLYEAVPESLKNVILVMNAAQILVPPSSNDQRTQQQRTLWTATSERMERFLPGFLVDVIPSLPEPELEPVVPDPAPTPS